MHGVQGSRGGRLLYLAVAYTHQDPTPRSCNGCVPPLHLVPPPSPPLDPCTPYAFHPRVPPTYAPAYLPSRPQDLPLHHAIENAYIIYYGQKPTPLTVNSFQQIVNNTAAAPELNETSGTSLIFNATNPAPAGAGEWTVWLLSYRYYLQC